MSIPYNNNLSLPVYQTNPNWHQNLQVPSFTSENETERAVDELFTHTFEQPVVRGIQFIRDTARLVLKVPIRAIATPIFLEKNWRERERAIVNAKLTGYSFVQLASVPVKFTVVLIALATSAISQDRAKYFLDKNEEWTAYLDGCASQLEALKEEGAKQKLSRLEFDRYKNWLSEIDPKLCRRTN